MTTSYKERFVAPYDHGYDDAAVECTHPIEERFVSRCFTIGGPPEGELLSLCAGCGADFGPAPGTRVARHYA